MPPAARDADGAGAVAIGARGRGTGFTPRTTFQRVNQLGGRQYVLLTRELLAEHKARRAAFSRSSLFEIAQIAAFQAVSDPPGHRRLVELEAARELGLVDLFGFSQQRALGDDCRDGPDGLLDRLRHTGLDACGNEIGNEVPDAGVVVVDGGENAPVLVLHPLRLVQEGMGADEVGDHPELAPQPDGDGRHKIGKPLGEGYDDGSRSCCEPGLQGLILRDRGFCVVCLGEGREDRLRLSRVSVTLSDNSLVSFSG